MLKLRSKSFGWLSLLALLLLACEKMETPYPATLVEIARLSDREPEKARPLLERLKDSLTYLNTEQRTYYDLLSLKVDDKEYVRHTSDSLIKRITSFYETYGDRDKLLESYYYMGRVYRDLEDAPEALKYFQKALDVVGDTKKYFLLSNIYSQMGTLYDYQNVYEESLSMYRKAYQYTLQSGDSTSLSLALRDIARTYDMIEQNDSAIYYYRIAADLSKQVDNRHRYSGILTELGDLYRETGVFDQALICLSESMSDSLGRNLYPTYVSIGHTYLELGELDSAATYLHKSQGSQDVYVKEGAYDYLSSLAERRADYPEAVRYMRLYKEVQDSIQKTITSEEIRRVTALYNYERKEKENLRLKVKNDQMQIRIYQLLALVGFFMSIALLLVFRHKRQKLQAAMQMQLLRKEKEVQYERSVQYIEDNKRKLRDIEERLFKEQQQKDHAQRALIQVQKELLEVVNERVQLQVEERTIQEAGFKHSDIYVKFHSMCTQDRSHLTDEDWQALQEELDKTYNGLTNRLYALYPNLSSMELHICYLIKISIRVTDMAKLLNRSKSSVSTARSRLFKKLTGEEGSPDKLDVLISDL